MQRNVACLMALLGFMANAAFATPIYIDSAGREWLDVNDTRFRSWNDTAAVCDALTGTCSGTLLTHDQSSSDVDLTGYHWAARAEVRDLFYEIAGLPSGSLDSYSALFPFGAGYGTNAFSAFDPTIQLSQGPGVVNILNGLTRDRYFNSDVMSWIGYSGIIGNPPSGSDAFLLNGGLPTGIREISMGVYVYRDVPVPEPGTLGLFGAALAALVALRRRRRQAG